MKNKHCAFARAVLISTLSVCIRGCIGTENGFADRPEKPDEPWRMTAEDARGASVTLEHVPRNVVLHVDLQGQQLSGTEGIYLFAGSADEALLEDLEAGPLRRENVVRSVPSTVRLTSDGFELTPAATLIRGATYTLAIAHWAQLSPARSRDDLPWFNELTVSEDVEDGAALLSTFPADGSANVPLNLQGAYFTFDGAPHGIAEGLWLQGADGVRVAAAVEPVDCAGVDSSASHCIRLEPRWLLAPHSRYHFASSTGLTDGRGAPITAIHTTFTTGNAPRTEAPRLTAPDCAVDEEATDIGCWLISDDRVHLRMLANVPARFELRTNDMAQAVLSSRGDAEITIRNLEPNAYVSPALSVTDLAGNVLSITAHARSATPRATVAMTEVRADPVGAEPSQEYVELFNYGNADVPLDGFTIANSTSETGCAITDPATIHADEHLLLVSDDYDANDVRDTQPPPGVVLIHMGKAICGTGLVNTGRALYLRDDTGHRISASPALRTAQAGGCIERRAVDMRSGEETDFVALRADGCSPGR
jgi:hypothetical protein